MAKNKNNKIKVNTSAPVETPTEKKAASIRETMTENKSKFSFVKNLRWFAILSVLLILPGLIGIITVFTDKDRSEGHNFSWFNFDIDFIGGTTFSFDFKHSVTLDEVTQIETLAKDTVGFKPSQVVRTSAMDSDTPSSVVNVKMSRIDSEKRTAFVKAMNDKFQCGDPIDERNVGGSVSRSLRDAAIWSALLASLLILLYITIRFEFKSGVAAIIALGHDLLVVLSAYVIFGIPVNMTFIAVILTILGYSINANIIVFDRVRETRRLENKQGFADVIDYATRVTLPRTINTTITTLIPVTLLIIMGVASVRDFAIPLFAGIACGAYTSIFISGPIWNLLAGKPKKAR